jgi:hypothetical protein
VCFLRSVSKPKESIAGMTAFIVYRYRLTWASSFINSSPVFDLSLHVVVLLWAYWIHLILVCILILNLWITFFRYAQNQNIWKPNNFKTILGARKPKGLNRITKIGYGYLCLREENLSFNDGCII